MDETKPPGSSGDSTARHDQPADYYDWRRGRTDQEIEGIQTNYEPKLTPEEKAQWEAVSSRVMQSYYAYVEQGVPEDFAQSMAQLNDEQLGYILAVAAQEHMAACRKFNVFNTMPHSLVASRKRNFTFEHYPHREVCEIIPHRILRGEKLNLEDFNTENYPEPIKSNLRTEEISNEIWHGLCQRFTSSVGVGLTGHLGSIPYIFSVTKENLRRILKSMFEDQIKEGLAVIKAIEDREAKGEGST